MHRLDIFSGRLQLFPAALLKSNCIKIQVITEKFLSAKQRDRKNKNEKKEKKI